ncbi:DUF6973 domain-containing protein [Nocardia higoensis]|uniref:DUF6973 domain-containing protein n=1 Tax=Nocardia higoensis TaxID=228599 RepID=UPI0002E975ED|nr:hypothetical protein [Nocardia higoensis]
MTDESPFTIPVVLGWTISPAERLPTELGSLANTIETDVEAANRDVQNSRDYFDSEAGDAMRTRFDTDRRNALATVDAIDSMKAPIQAVASIFRSAKSTIVDTIRLIEASEYELFYTDDGQVLSKKSVMDWMNDSLLTGVTKAYAVERTRRAFQSALQGALNDIWTADLEYNAEINLVLEQLPNEVREALIATPSDPELARILEEYQVSASDTTVVFPSGALLDIIRTFKPDIEPKAMTQEEAQALIRLAGTPPEGVYNLKKFYDIQDEATLAAETAFPELDSTDNKKSLADGHSDAFRHMYWNARMTQEFGPEWTSTFASAHEMIGSNPAAREAMDLYNNEVGRNIGSQNMNAGSEELQQKVLEAINNNQAIVIQDTPGGGQIAFSNSVAPGTNAILPGADIPMPEGN